MKKRLISLLLVLLLLALTLPAAFAEGETQTEESAQVFPYVLDQAGLLRDSLRETLEQKAAALSEEHRCSLYIVTVEDHTSFNADVYEAAKGIFNYYALGWGDEKDGVILLLSMNERDYAFAGHGSRGEAICGYESSWLIEDQFLDNFRNDDWYGGFVDYLDACAGQLTKLDSGEDITEGADIITGPDGLEYHSYNAPGGSTERSILPRVIAVIAIPILVALIVCSIFRAQMKTAKEAVRADEYLVPHSMKLRIKEDRFTHRTESRVKIESDSGSRGGGGGSSFHSGGGFSGRSGKF